MSVNSTLAELGQEIVAQYFPTLITYYVGLPAAVLVFYDYILTIQLELSTIWTGKMNLMKALFLVNRYGGIMYQYASIFLYFFKPASDLECSAFDHIVNLTDTLSNLAIYSIFTLRTFAIYGRSWLIFFVLAIPALGDIAANIWTTVAQTASALPRQLQVGPNTCSFGLSFSGFASQLTSSVCAPVFDAVVVILTVYRTAYLAKYSREAGIRSSLSYILLRDGAVYYLTIFLPLFASFVLNAVILKDGNISLSYVADDFDAFALALRNIAVNRLVLSLSHSHATNSLEDSEYFTRSGFQLPVFTQNSILGNIGGLLDSGLDDFEDQEVSGM